MDYTNFFNGYRDRIMRIALFDLFSNMEKKQKKDHNNKPIDFFGIGLLSLMFFFENMLKRNRKTGIHELATFLHEIQKEYIDLNEEEYLELAKIVIETMRPPSGKRNRKVFMNYETGEEDYVEYSILKADSWDQLNNLQYYVLDEQGLELIFSTKEYFSEFQISISQLLLRKQLEKGEFHGALRQIEEMRISVNLIKEKIHGIKHDIQRNIISEETYKRYKELVADINSRLEIEHHEFEELSVFIKDTKLHLDGHQVTSNNDRKALDYIVKVDNELSEVHHMHSMLLNESIELKTSALDAASETLYHIGLTSFNFDQEITRKVMTNPLPFESTKLFTAPFMKSQKQYTWSLLTLLSEQYVEDDKKEKDQHIFVDVADEGEISEERVIQQKVNAFIFNKIHQFVDAEGQVTFKSIIEKHQEAYMNTREFHDFFIIMHQLSPIDIDEMKKSKDHIFAKAFNKLNNGCKTIEVVELDDVVISEGYEMKDMMMTFKTE